ncbi:MULTISPECIES: hypothetical protein [Agrobacterium]|uniref:hypothetical protein n=1 Tax=Agrobacterium TaxID=357 RepID=UPI0007615EE6|nr:MULTISPECIES: hypothetical protein [Agrobacterium]KAB0459930.1 hypothetical protein F7R04_13645 [Agrobacterium tumefaciens]KWT76937.1 hypothetical protein ASH09_11300 [Agrobacterium radiobacter]MDH0117217.1 hypothetical protein [Agrobacterium pusense]NIB11286.1 hypothetical protein [Agrobacterium radiobacter]OOO38406.1 hypothetical protein BS628_09750 [Agrobacterium radiobacter]
MIELVKSFVSSGVGQALIIALITAIVARIFTPKGKLIWGVSHQHHYRMPNLSNGETFPVVTQQVWFQNTGRSPIQEIEVVLNWKPQHFEIWDPRHWGADFLPDRRFVIKIPSLNSREIFTVSMIDTVNELPAVLSVRWLGGIGKQVEMVPQRQFSTAFNVTVLTILFAGTISIFYFLLQVVLWAIGTPSA